MSAIPLFDAPNEHALPNGSTVIECEQHSGEWFTARMGIPTASRFNAIITSKGDPCKAAARRTYIEDLATERITRVVTEHHVTAAMARGTALEPRARAWYEFDRDTDVETVGFVRSADRLCGASPDGLVGSDGGIEIKCPLKRAFVRIALADKFPSEHVQQVQGCLWVTGRAWWDLVVYSDDAGLDHRPLVYRVEPDPVIHAALDDLVPAFCAEVDATAAKLMAALYGETAK